MYIINFIRGFFMALADSVPGVSGGTVAFVLGFYDKFINSLNALTSKNKDMSRKEALTFLAKIGIGWACGFILSVLFLSSLFEEYIYQISSLFSGFILFSIPLIIKEEKSSIKGHYGNIIFSIIGVIVVGAITYFNPITSGSGLNISFDNLSVGLMLYVFVAGVIAISAMVLPGISGSTLLLIFGLYVPIINSIKQVLTFNFGYLPILIIFGLGVILGVISVVRLLRALLLKYRSKIIYFILGLMLGSLYAVFMGPTTLDVPKAAMDISSFSIVFFLIGGLLIFGLDRLRFLMEKRDS